jgi:hypothetical protein
MTPFIEAKRGEAMHKALLIAVTGILTGLVCCGGSETPPNGNGGSAAGTGGVTSTGGSTTNPTGGSMIPEGCNLPTCLSSIMQGCVPSGTCVMQDTNLCYSNGVKQISKMNIDFTTQTMDTSVTYKKDNAVCYSFSFLFPVTSQTATDTTMNVKDSAGTTVATIGVDSSTSKITATCTGGSSIVINDKCDKSMIPDVANLAGTTNTCTQGTCTP